MMDFRFTPLSEPAAIKVPYIEDARANFAPYYGTEKKLETIQSEIIVELAKLGGYGVYFQQGTFGDKPKRYGYIIHFQFNGEPGLFRVAGLPMYTETPKKRNQVLAQALCIVRDWCKQMVTSKVFQPGSEPLVQFLLVNERDGVTIIDHILASGKLPMLTDKVEEVQVEVVE